MARTNTEIQGKLKFWIINPATALGPGWLAITCPNCGGTAGVKKSKWCRKNGFTGRSCTYCFKVARLPDQV